MSWRVLALLIVLGALALRLYRVEAQSLWYDEGITAGLATRSLRQIALNAADDIHPPLYYWLLALWARGVGDGVFALRAFSAMIGTVLVAGVLVSGRRLFGPAVALAAGVLAALSPYLVWYSQEVRMYILAGAWGVALVWLTLDLISHRPPHAVRLSWIAYVAVAVAALHTHYFAGLSVLAIANVVVVLAVVRAVLASWGQAQSLRDSLGQSDRGALSDSPSGLGRRAGGEGWRNMCWRDRELAEGVSPNPIQPPAGFLWRWALAQVAAVVLFAPWLLRAWPTIRDWPALGEATTGRFLLRESVRTFSLGVSWPPTASMGAGVMLVLAICGAIAGLSFGRRWGTLVALAWTATPVALMWLLSLVRPAWDPKFLIVAAPGFELLAGAGAVAVGMAAARAASLFSSRGAVSLGTAVTVGLLLLAIWPRTSALQAAFSTRHINGTTTRVSFDGSPQRPDLRT